MVKPEWIVPAAVGALAGALRTAAGGGGWAGRELSGDTWFELGADWLPILFNGLQIASDTWFEADGGKAGVKHRLQNSSPEN